VYPIAHGCFKITPIGAFDQGLDRSDVTPAIAGVKPFHSSLQARDFGTEIKQTLRAPPGRAIPRHAIDELPEKTRRLRRSRILHDGDISVATQL
jgi:hypothetical protein